MEVPVNGIIITIYKYKPVFFSFEYKVYRNPPIISGCIFIFNTYFFLDFSFLNYQWRIFPLTSSRYGRGKKSEQTPHCLGELKHLEYQRSEFSSCVSPTRITWS